MSCSRPTTCLSVVAAVALVAVVRCAGTGPEAASRVTSTSQDAFGARGTETSSTLGFDVVSRTKDVAGEVASSSGGEFADFGKPCGQNGDCSSGFCVDGPKGSVCTKPCLDHCPDGYVCKGVQSGGADVAFLCVPRGGALCTPCVDDLQCNGGACAFIDGTGACSVTCTGDTNCPPQYVCRELTALAAQPGATAATFMGCVPPNGTCSCDAKTVGLKRTCFHKSELGSCAGVEACDAESGWVGCDAKLPSAESCNGIDDDCDGLIDEGLPATVPCQNTVDTVGVCDGVSVCAGTSGWVCQAAAPVPEKCNYLDDDCDGLIDEPSVIGGKYLALEHCGSCGHSCLGTVPHGVPACIDAPDGPRCGVASCDAGYFAVGGIQCLPELQDTCQACSAPEQCYYPGAACLLLEDGSFCTKPCSADADCPSGTSCVAVSGFGTQCVPSTGSCTCDGKNLALKRECTKTTGGNGGPLVTCKGAESCTAGGWGACELPSETCNGVDDDCDGVLDDGFRDPVTGKYGTDAHCGQCGNGCLALVFANAHGACNAGLPVPACTMVCDPGHVDVDQNPTTGCECLILGDTDVPHDGDANCDGVDGEVDNAIFVAKGGSDANAGTRAAPVLTVQKGIALAKAQKKRDVYVATGVYVESIVLVAGVSVYGGYSADGFSAHDPEVFETAILGVAPTAALPGAVNALGIGGTAGATRIDGFTIFGADGQGEGASSYAVYLRDATHGVRVSGCRVIAGDGTVGADGSAGTNGASGKAGKAGVAAKDIATATCSASHHNAGGGGASGTCGGTDVSGGGGGTAICPDYDTSGTQPKSDPISQTATAAEGGGAGKNTGAGAGGVPGYDNGIFDVTSSCGTCHIPPDGKDNVGGVGKNGAVGSAGAAGSPCSDGDGSVSNGLWTPASGGSAQAGSHGGGGGGGGAAGGVETLGCGASVMKYTDIGGSGGGGGSAGCGGTAGGGGGGGGGSFGIFVVFTAPPTSLPGLDQNVIFRGRGGNGGHGGSGGVGGFGGSGGNGGASGASGGWITFCAGNGGQGGDGGAGGSGGGGAGGCGGAAYGIFVSGQAGVSLAAYKNDNSAPASGGAGSGGPGGVSLGNAGPKGASGSNAAFNF